MTKKLKQNFGFGTAPVVLALFTVGAVMGTWLSIASSLNARRQQAFIWKSGPGFYASEGAAMASFAINDTGGCGLTTKSGITSKSVTTSHVCFERPMVEGFYTAVSQSSGLCLELQNGSASPTAPIDQDTCVESLAGQIWQLVRVGAGFQMVSQSSGQCLDTNTARPHAMKQSLCAAVVPMTQLFNFLPVADGTYQIQSQNGAWISTENWNFSTAIIPPNVATSASPGILQGYREINQTIDFPSTGTFNLNLQLAKSASDVNNPSVMISIDGFSVGAAMLTTSTYSQYTTNTFTVAAGSHTLNLKLGASSTGNPPSYFAGVVVNVAGNFGFEAPALALADSLYSPFAATWAYTGDTFAIASNGSDLTSHNPTAPGGTQVAVFTGLSGISQTLRFPGAGTFIFKLKAAKHANDAVNQTVQLLMDGTVIGTFTPSSVNYSTFSTNIFTVSAGYYTLALQGTVAGSVTALVDALTIEQVVNAN